MDDLAAIILDLLPRADRYDLLGPFIPYTRMTQRSKWQDRAQAYLASQAAISNALLEQRQRRFDRTPLAMGMIIEMAAGLHRQDLDNQVKALTDAAQGVILGNDLWVDAILAVRRLSDVDRVTLLVDELKGA